jgi:reductive dehalogenase
MELPTLISIILGSLLFIFLLLGSFVLLKERAYRGAIISVIFSIMLLPPFLMYYYSTQIGANNYPYIIIIVFAVTFLLILINPKSQKFAPQTPVIQFDERQTMFSRNELKVDTELYNSYYTENPEHKEKDDTWRSKPGLLNPQSVFYDPISFAAADASFLTIEKLGPYIKGEPAKDKKTENSQQLTTFVKKWLKKQGMASVGITEMQTYHYYHTKGRRDTYDKKVSPSFKYGIAFTIEMDEEMMQAAPKGSAIMESAEKYLKSGIPAVQLAYFLRELGFNAQAHIDGNYEVVCPLVARDAGLGEIGRMGLLMTPKLGPRVRIAVVTTDAPLIIDKPSNIAYSMNEFCHYCKKCAHVCPSQSIPLDGRKVQDEVLRWKIDSESCFTYWQTAGTDCGRCMTVCPYAHANNWFHNFIRFGIRHSYLFRRLAVVLDDVFYGKKPPIKKMPKWIGIRS